MKRFAFLPWLLAISVFGSAQTKDVYVLLKPDRVFDGEQMQTGWVVLVKNNMIEEAGPMTFKLPPRTAIMDLKGCTLLPGLIEGHSHLFLHPYNETSWNDQVLTESRAERTARAVNHARATLSAGFTTVRDLGTEGCMYDDVGLKHAIEKNVIPGPRMIVATRAIVARGTYGPKTDNPDINLPQGAAEVAGIEGLTEEIRTQMGKGADLIKIYADFPYGTKSKEALPTFSVEALTWAAEIARNGGRPLVAHATSAEGMRRAALAGATTIEHGDEGTAAVFKLMKEKGVAYCPTLAAGEAYATYEGWRKGIDPEPERMTKKRNSFRLALESGVTICMGGDVGVFPHGDNARELEIMVDYGMKPLDVLRSATSVNATVFGYGDKIGRIKKGLLADLITVEGDPTTDIKLMRKVKLVMKDGVVYQE